FLPCTAAHHALPSFPTRRSSDLRRRRVLPQLGHGLGGNVDAHDHARPTTVRRVVHAVGAVAREAAQVTQLYAQAAVADGLAEERSEEHTSELQSRENLVCRLLLE